MEFLNNHPEIVAFIFVILSVITGIAITLTIGKIMFDIILNKKERTDFYSIIITVLSVLIIIFSNISGYFLYRVINNLY